MSTEAAAPDPEREYRLISQLEMRIAGADTDEKLEAILLKFLPALILKLASPTAPNRNLAIKVCQYVNQRLKINDQLQVPVGALVKTFREAQNAFVRRFCLIFIELGLPRLETDQSIHSLPEILQFAIPTDHDYDASDGKMWCIAFDFLLQVLRRWKLPERGTPADAALQDAIPLSPFQSQLLTSHLCKFLLYDPKDPAAQAGDDDFGAVLDKNFQRRAETVVPVAQFLLTPVFTDQQRLTPAVILAVDPNASAASIGDIMFKQCNFDMESDQSVDALFDLYRQSKPKLQTRILSVLSRSKKSTTRTAAIVAMVEEQLSGAPGAGLESAKHRSALFSYLAWTVRVGERLAEMGQRVQYLVKDYIELQGWPTITDKSMTAEVELRAKAYETFGLMAATHGANVPHISDLDDRTLDMVIWLFTSLRCDATRDVKRSIEDAIGRMMTSLPPLDDRSAARLKDLLLWNVLATPGQADSIYHLPTVNATTYPALRFANKCLPFDDSDARLINVLALGTSDRREVTEEALHGLDPFWHAANVAIGSAAARYTTSLPPIGELVRRFFPPASEQPNCYANLPAVTAAIIFARNVMICGAVRDTQTPAPDASADWKQTIDALVDNDADARARIRAYLQILGPDIAGPLLNTMLLGASKASADCLDLCLEVLSLAPSDLLQQVRSIGLQVMSQIAATSGLQLRAARVFGILASVGEDAEATVALHLREAGAWKAAIGEALVQVQGHLLRACFCLTRMALRGNHTAEAANLKGMTDLVTDIIMTASDKSLKEVACRSLRQLALCIPLADFLVSVDQLLTKLTKDGKGGNEAAVSAIGPILGNLFSPSTASELDPFITNLLGLHEVRRPEFHFSLGEALAVAIAGLGSSSTLAELDVDASPPAWGFNEPLAAVLVERVLGDCKSTKPTLRKAAAIWLLCLTQYCGDVSAIKSRLRDCQAAFARLLSDRDEIVQETGSRGLSVVYERGDKHLRDDLVRDLVQTFTGNNAKMSGSIDEDSQLFETGALPTESGQSVTTYKDIVQLATEMGDPSLVYRFMNLASNNAIWSSRAAFGRFGLGRVLADSTLLAENQKFYPKLFRYRFDPNPAVQRSMNEIWRALVKDPHAVINEHFDLIMADLLKSVVSGKEWRAREASCAAIADLLHGREVEVYEKYLDDIWQVAFKVLDDVKETVRVAAMKLCRTLTSQLIRNLEVGDGNSKRSATMLNHAMPFLLQQMEGGAGQEVQQYAIATLLQVVKKCPPRSLRRFAPEILETLVVSLSSLEHESINYLHLNADKYGLTADKLDQMRVSSVSASPVTNAIERCLESITLPGDEPRTGDGIRRAVDMAEVAPMEDAMQRLVHAYRATIGLPSKVGLSRVMITLVVRHPTAFRPYADTFSQLTRKHVLDRNTTISVAFSTSLGYLMRLASEREVRATSRHAQKLYFESQELTHRAVAGEMVQAISRAANDVFMKAASAFLPFAFVGRRDTDAEVRGRFDGAWADNIGGSRAINLYLTEIVALISTHMGSALWPIRHACAFAVAELVSTMEAQDRYSDGDALLIWGILQPALDGKAWDGKEDIIRVYPTFVKRAPSLWADTATSQQMRKIAVREAKRTNVRYRPRALEALGDFAAVRRDLDLSGDVVPYLRELLNGVADDDDVMDVDGDESSAKPFDNRKTVMDDTARAIVWSTFKILTSATPATVEVLDSAVAIVQTAQAMRSTSVDGALYEAATFLVAESATSRTRERGRETRTRGDGERGGDGDGGSQSQSQSRTLSPNGTGASEPSMAPASGERRVEKKKSLGAPPADGEGRQTPFEAFQPLLAQVLVSDASRQASEPESQRKSRVELALAVAEAQAQAPPSDRAWLAAILEGWLRTERSRPLRQTIEQARAATSRPK